MHYIKGALFQGEKQIAEKHEASWASSLLYSRVPNRSESEGTWLCKYIKNVWNYTVLAIQLRGKKSHIVWVCMGFPIWKKEKVFLVGKNGKGSWYQPKSRLQAGLLVVSWDITQWQLTFCPLTLPQPSHSCLFPLSQADLSCQLIDNVSLLRCHVMLLSMWKYIKCPSLL